MGATVTIYLDKPAAETPVERPRRRSARAATTPRAIVLDGSPEIVAAGGDYPRDVVPESPDAAARRDHRSSTRANQNRNHDHRAHPSGGVGADSSSDSPRALRRALASLAAEHAAGRAALREAEDSLAAAEMARERDQAAALDRELADIRSELARASRRADQADCEARRAKAKEAAALKELTECRNECQRFRAQAQALETRWRLERDLAAEGEVAGEDELIRRFDGAARKDPKRAIETLCRALAGKNKRLHQQTEEYGKLARALKQRDKALAERDKGAPGLAQRHDPILRGDERGRKTGGSSLSREKTLGFARAKRGWDGGDDGIKIKTNPGGEIGGEPPSLFDANGLFGDGAGAAGASARIAGAAADRKRRRAPGSPVSASRHAPLGRVVAPARRSPPSDGVDLLDDILESLDAPAKGRGGGGSVVGAGGARVGPPGRAPLASNRPRGNAAASFIRGGGDERGGGGGASGTFVIHGADGRGGRAKVVRTAREIGGGGGRGGGGSGRRGRRG